MKNKTRKKRNNNNNNNNKSLPFLTTKPVNQSTNQPLHHRLGRSLPPADPLSLSLT